MNPLGENKTLSAASLNGTIGACRLNIDVVDELVRLLEGCDWRTYIKMNLPDGKQVHLDGDQITVLRKAYFITLLQQYGPSDEDRDLLLAAAGLLAGYENIDNTETNKSGKITPRLAKYKEETQAAIEIDSLTKNERNKLDKFSKDLYAKRQVGVIDLWNDVLHYLGVDDFGNIPKHITLPTPSYLKRTLTPQSDPASSQETEQVEITDTEVETAQEAEQTETVGTKVAADQDTAIPAPDPDSRSQPDTQQPPDPTPQSPPTPIPVTVTENTVQQNAFLVRALGVVSIIAVACLVLVVIWQNVVRWPATDSAPDIMATQEIVSIDFVELSELRVLAPGESIVLALEIVPDEIGPEELDYTSDKPEVAYTDKNAVTALSDLPSSIDEVVTITAQKGVAEDKTYVHVLGTDSVGIGHGANAAGDDTGGGE